MTGPQPQPLVSGTPTVLSDTPLVVLADPGGNPSAAIALASLAMTEPRWQLCVCVDEFPDRRRTKFTRHLLNSLGREDVRVVAGRVLRNRKQWSATGLYPDLPVECADIYDAMARVCDTSTGRVRCLNIGPLTDLADLLVTDPQHLQPLGLAHRLWIWCTADPLNIHRDAHAADEVISRAEHLSLVRSDRTIDPTIAISADSGIYQLLDSSPHLWAQMLESHLSQWFRAYRDKCTLLDPLAATAALGLGYVRFSERDSVLGADRHMSADTGARASLSTNVDGDALIGWVEVVLRDGRPARRPGWEISLDALLAEAACRTGRQ